MTERVLMLPTFSLDDSNIVVDASDGKLPVCVILFGDGNERVFGRNEGVGPYGTCDTMIEYIYRYIYKHFLPIPCDRQSEMGLGAI